MRRASLRGGLVKLKRRRPGTQEPCLVANTSSRLSATRTAPAQASSSDAVAPRTRSRTPPGSFAESQFQAGAEAAQPDPWRCPGPSPRFVPRSCLRSMPSALPWFDPGFRHRAHQRLPAIRLRPAQRTPPAKAASGSCARQCNEQYAARTRSPQRVRQSSDPECRAGSRRHGPPSAPAGPARTSGVRDSPERLRSPRESCST